MNSNRLEDFSDGVLAIVITIMVLEMKAPNEASLTALLPVIPVFISYHMSYVYIGIYWNNHHHLMQAVDKINGKVLWPISICCSGYHSSRLLPAGLEKIILNLNPWPYMA